MRCDLISCLGSAFYGAYGDGGQATSATFENIAGVTGDKDGRVYISDFSKHLLFEVTSLIVHTSRFTLHQSGVRGWYFECCCGRWILFQWR